MSTVDIHILGQKYTIKGEASEAEIRSLAGLIEGKVREVTDLFPNISSNQTLILTLFNMAEELNRLNSEQDTIARHVTEKAEALAGLFD